MRVVLLTISIGLLLGPLTAQAVLYKWVDDEGRVHFGDQIPVRFQLKAHDEMSQRGIVLKHREAAKTPEEKAAARLLAKERKKIELTEKKKKQRDRVLLDTYTTERDLIVARDSRLEAVGSQVQLAETIISDSNKTIDSLEKQVVQIKASNREVPADIYQRIDSEKQQVKVQSQVKQGHIKRRDDITAQFNDYVERFKVLKDEQEVRRNGYLKEREENY
jgi:hypothetical protein